MWLRPGQMEVRLSLLMSAITSGQLVGDNEGFFVAGYSVLSTYRDGCNSGSSSSSNPAAAGMLLRCIYFSNVCY